MTGKSLSHLKIYDFGNFDVEDYFDLFKQAEFFLSNKNKLKLIAGGDHSISIPFQKAFIEKCKKDCKEPIIIHIDAHCDICDEYLGSKFSHACTIKRALDNGLKSENLYMVGIREFEQDGYNYFFKTNCNSHLFLSIDICENGFSKLFEDLSKKNNDNYRIYISFDIDSLDSSYVPGTGTPETCGLTPFNIRTLFLFLSSFKNIDVFDIVEIAPNLDSNDITTWCAVKLLYEFLGNYKTYHNKNS